jgi:hypothetical protein
MMRAIVNDRVAALYGPKCQGPDKIALHPDRIGGFRSVGLTRM